jgi:hypothetical protein
MIAEGQLLERERLPDHERKELPKVGAGYWQHFPGESNKGVAGPGRRNRGPGSLAAGPDYRSNSCTTAQSVA